MTNDELQQLLAIIAVILGVGAIFAMLLKQYAATAVLLTLSWVCTGTSIWLYFHPHVLK